MPFWCSHGWLVSVRVAPAELAGRVPALAGRLAVLDARRDADAPGLAEAAAGVPVLAAGMVVERLAGKATPQLQGQRNWSALPTWRRYAPTITHWALSTMGHDVITASKHAMRAGMPRPAATKPPDQHPRGPVRILMTSGTFARVRPRIRTGPAPHQGVADARLDPCGNLAAPRRHPELA